MVNRPYLFYPLSSNVNGHTEVNSKVLESYYAVHGGDSLVEWAKAEGVHEARTRYHAIGHAVGKLLFEREGALAIESCGDAFDWGCLHEVVGFMQEALGPDSLDQAAEQCRSLNGKRRVGQCIHGLGHGLVYETGYELGKINEVMKVCDKFSPERPIPWTLSCHGGAMMEYNERFLLGGDMGSNRRSVNRDNPFDVCDSMQDTAHKKVCILISPLRIHSDLFQSFSRPSVLASLGSTCDTLKQLDLRETCYGGIGLSVGLNANLRPESVVSLCESASDVPLYQKRCIQFAANRFVYARKRTEAAKICALVESDQQRRCDPEYLQIY